MAKENNSDRVSLEMMKKYAPNFEAVLRKHGMNEEADTFMEPFTKFGAEFSDFELDPTWSEEFYLDLEKAATGYRGMKGAIQSYRQMRAHPDKVVPSTVESMFEGLRRLVASQTTRGWIFKINKEDAVNEAYLVTSVYYVKEQYYGRGRDRRREPPYVTMHMAANSADVGENYSWKGVTETSVTFRENDLGKTIPQLLFDKQLRLETPELLVEYDTSTERFVKFQPMEGKQFLATGKAWGVERSRWSRPKNWSFGDEPAKVVNDEGILERRIKKTQASPYWAEQGKDFTKLPIHPYVMCFDLTRHENCWVHVDNMEIYEYDLSLREKIVLPPDHRDLIEILTTDLDVFAEVGDIIKGKSGGSAILCVGKPGLGKTLTAEVYGEVTQKPLYKVHSGQLGTTAKEVEGSLEEVLKRAERWGAVMLIDEADVFIRQRDNDPNHNAIVASFLRTLEYFHGLLFMTTNREFDVDDAIVSRMIAIFKYEQPKPPEAAKIWRIMANEFKLELTDETIEELTKSMNLSGRDIKQLIKLTAKYATRKQIKLTYDAFRICSMFRGLN